MKRSDLEALETQIMEEVVRRRKLGGYSTDAEGILKFGEVTLRVLQHLIENYPEQEMGKRHAVSKKDKST